MYRIVMLIMLCPMLLDAQQSWDITAGILLQKEHIGNSLDPSGQSSQITTGYQVGIVRHTIKNKQISMSWGLAVSKKHLWYVDLQQYWDLHLKGPVALQAGYLLGFKASEGRGSFIDPGLLLGLSYDIDIARLQLQYHHGFNNLNGDLADSIPKRNRPIVIGIAVPIFEN